MNENDANGTEPTAKRPDSEPQKALRQVDLGEILDDMNLPRIGVPGFIFDESDVPEFAFADPFATETEDPAPTVPG